MNLKSALILLAASIAGSSFAQVTGTFTLDQSGIVGTNVGNGFVGLSHDTFVPDAGHGPAYSFYGFCTDLEVEAAWNNPYYPYTRVDTNSFYKLNQYPTLSPQLGSEVSFIANTYAFTGNADVATAAQLAIWEVQGMSLADVQTFLNGTFSATVANKAAYYVATAEADYSAGDRSVSPWYEAPINVDGRQITQNFVQPVPEPSTIALGLGILGLTLRRRSTRKA